MQINFNLLQVLSWISLLYKEVEGNRRDSLIVNTSKGRVRGVRYRKAHLGQDTSVDVFLGIPYAKAPINDLRFRHPKQVDPWPGVFNATKQPNSCYQSPDEFFGNFQGSTMWNPNTPVSEDCLFINVWVPRKNGHKPRKLAVMVWIYGGSFFSGTTTLNVYDGLTLSGLNDVIVVSIGYRLGALGFFTLNHPNAPGNAGLFDQLMGLEWVQQNIRAFGGDPDKVTLFGESAGSVSVSLHLLSPLSQNNFKRAIMQSGTANMDWGTLSMAEGTKRSRRLAIEHLECPDSHDVQMLIECMRKIPAQKIIDEQWIALGIMQFTFLPVVDGSFLIEPPSKSLRERQFKECPILLGSNQNEATFFLAYDLPAFLKLNETSMTREQFIISIKDLFYYYPQYPERMNEFGIQAIMYQYTNWIDLNDKYANIAALDAAVSDRHFICEVNEFAHAYADSGEAVYSYYFTERFSANPWPLWAGVLHGDEILFVFGQPFKPELGYTYTERERDFSFEIMTYWTNFAKTGDPNTVPGARSLNEWPLYTPEGKQYLELNSKFLNNPDKSEAVGRGPRTRECAFWKHYLPQLIMDTDNRKQRPNSAEPTTSPIIQKNLTCGQCPSVSSITLMICTILASIIYQIT